LSRTDLRKLALQKEVLFINELHHPKEELNTGAVDYTLNKVTKTHHVFSGIKGDSIYISVKERAFDTTDIDIKNRNFLSGVEAATQTVHANVMATIIAGAGNSSPFALGVSPSAFVSSANFANLFPEPDLLYQQKKISIQNHSYGTIVENFYGNEAVAYDVNTINNPQLVQVFSAGNSGTVTPTTGMYANVQAMANLTGNFKQSKNTISVAALDSSGAPMPAASRGPAYDGRIKPELTAYGEDGSSGAAALVSGSVALIQEAYKKNNRQLPSSELVKTVLINSADDAGPAGLDYLTGYGSLNTCKAVETITQNNFFQSNVTQSETKTFSLTVPSNISRLKVTVAWNDVAAGPNAAKALVNDVDVVVKNMATAEILLPWVLNPMAVKDSLVQPAQRKRDTLNNVEQITIDVPAAGVYQIEIKGSKITTGMQSFAVAFAMDTANSFSWDYPTGSDALTAGTIQTLRWSSRFSGSGLLQYSLDGTTWQPIAAVASLTANQYKWNVPDTAVNALLRMVVFSQSFVSDTVTISPRLSVRVGFNCADSFQLYWKKLPVAQYQVYRLGDNYLEPLLVTSDTSVVLKKLQNPSLYYSVAPLIATRPTVRSNTISYTGAGVGCYIVAFYLQSQTPSAAFFTAELGTLIGVKEVSLQKLTANSFVTIQTTTSLTGTLFNFSDASLLKGENIYRLKLTLLNGSVVYSDIETLYHFGDSPVYVYPNPARSGEGIKIISNESGRYTVRIFNSAGKEVYQQFITNSFTTLQSSGFAKGLYFVWIMDKEGAPFVQKLLIQ
jgi:hypothetical protein